MKIVMLRNFTFVRIYSINFSFYYYYFFVSVLFVFIPAARKQLGHLEMFSLNFSSLSFAIRVNRAFYPGSSLFLYGPLVSL